MNSKTNGNTASSRHADGQHVKLTLIIYYIDPFLGFSVKI